MRMSEFPLVSIILPCRNEERYIGPCLESILATTYPPDRFEVLVVDGRSDDGTRSVVAQLAAAHPRIRLLDNPLRITPVALNIGIEAASGEIIVRMDAHVAYPPEYLPWLVTALQETGADNVGGGVVTLPADDTPIARAIAVGLSRSEEHTSELQSPCNLVCRLLLEKKKTNISVTFTASEAVPNL